jgi:uncharacterized membrane protein YedE/YeeE
MQYLMPLLGGALIGLAISVLLYLNGKVAGVSGIVSASLGAGSSWQRLFLLGLLFGGFFLRVLDPRFLESSLHRAPVTLIGAGLLVGFGTAMGNGCTSGHGICGLSRLSRRSIVATFIFMIFGIVAATLFRHWMGVSA